MARECAQAWGQSRPSSSTPVPSVPSPSSSPVQSPVPPSVSSSPVPASSPSNVKSPVPNVNSSVPKKIPESDENWVKIKSLLDTELSKFHVSEYIEFHSFVTKFMASFSVPDCYRPPIYQALQSFVRSRRSR